MKHGPRSHLAQGKESLHKMAQTTYNCLHHRIQPRTQNKWSRTVQTNGMWEKPKTISRNCRTFKFHQSKNIHLTKAALSHWAHVIMCRTKRGEGEGGPRTASPASRVSRSPDGNNRHPLLHAVSVLKDEKHRADNAWVRQQKNKEKQGEDQPFEENQNAKHSNVKAPAATTWQFSPLCQQQE